MIEHGPADEAHIGHTGRPIGQMGGKICKISTSLN